MSAPVNVFQPIGHAIPPQIPRWSQHPVHRVGILAGFNRPIQTNKFYANLFLGGRHEGVWTHPYGVCWCQGRGNSRSWGLAVSHIDADQRAFGPSTDHNSLRYYINPIGIYSMILSAAELGSETSMTLDSPEAFSVNVNLAPTPNTGLLVTFPLVQGMGFVTGIYRGATPLIQSNVFFREVNGPSPVSDPMGITYKYQVTLEDGRAWLVYATPDPGCPREPFKLINNTTLRGPAGWSGAVSIAKNPSRQTSENIFDGSAGVYPLTTILSGSAADSVGTYTMRFVTAGRAGKTPLMFALPHHVESFDAITAAARTDIKLATTTKGMATAVVAESWKMVESTLPVTMGFAPWTPDRGSINELPEHAVEAVNAAAEVELQQDIPGQTNVGSMYFSGKGLGKFAAIVYAAHDLGRSPSLAHQGLEKLKKAFAVFVENRQTNPLVYDNDWHGIVSSAGYPDAMADFGNAYYNDHHFHYGYFVYTAAVIAYIDSSWLSQGSNKVWVDMLVNDFANPVDGPELPFSRAFDWYHGHSWAKGLFASADGKDQESTSEDAFASYAVKMWGHITSDASMEARGNLMLAIQARSFRSYFLMEVTNRNQPVQIVHNKVTGILFENKVDWATYFGDVWYYKQGIHMIPVHVPSAYIRSPAFVREEFNTFMSKGRINKVEGGWRGILYANLAIIDPEAAYNFFANSRFDNGLLDGGASRTWCLAYTAALGGASETVKYNSRPSSGLRDRLRQLLRG